MANLIPSDPSQADPSIVALMAGIKSNEGGTNYNALGDKNSQGQYTAAGIGQWSNQVNGTVQPLQKGQIPTNFANAAKQYGLDPTDFSPANQNKVMYARVAEDKNAGLQPEQILSKWNSGDPNTYLNPATSTGTGSVGPYDVAGYVKRGMSVAQQYAQSQGIQNQNNPIPTAQASTGQPQQSQGGGFLGTLGNIGQSVYNTIASPFVGAAAAPVQGLAKLLGQPDPYNNPNTAMSQGKTGIPSLGGSQTPVSQLGLEQKAGDAAQIGSYFLPGSTIPRLAGIGALQGAGQAASQGQDIGGVAGNAAIGAATGGALGVGGKIASFIRPTSNQAVNQLQGGLSKAFTATKSAGNMFSDLKTGGFNADEFLANKNLYPDIVDRHYDSTAAVSTLEQQIKNLSDVRTEALGSYPNMVKFDDLKENALDAVTTPQNRADGTLLARQAQVSGVIDTYKKIYGDSVPLNTLSEIKSGLDSLGKYDATVSNPTRDTYKQIGRVAKESIENEVQKADPTSNNSVQQFNKYIQQHYQAIDMLNKINGNAAKGGSLSRYALGIAGSIAASGGGPLSSLLGFFGGEYGSDLITSNAVTNPLRNAVLNKLKMEDPAIVNQFLNKAVKNAPATTPNNILNSISKKISPTFQRSQGNNAGGTLSKSLLLQNLIKQSPLSNPQ